MAITESSERLLLPRKLLPLRLRSPGDDCDEPPPTMIVDVRKQGESGWRGGGGRGDSTSRDSGDNGCCCNVGDEGGDNGGEGAEGEISERKLWKSEANALLAKRKRCRNLVSALMLMRRQSTQLSTSAPDSTLLPLLEVEGDGCWSRCMSKGCGDERLQRAMRRLWMCSKGGGSSDLCSITGCCSGE